MDLDEGRLKAWLDGALSPEDAHHLAARVDGDPGLQRRVEELRARELRTRDLLARLDTAPPPTDRVRAIVHTARAASRETSAGTRRSGSGISDSGISGSGTGRSGSGTGRPGSGSGRSGSGHWARRSRLAQAAALVLIFAGAAAAAIPGSPVHEWIARTLAPASDPSPASVSAPTDDPDTQTGPDETGLVVSPDSGHIRIELVGLPSGTEIVVRLTEEGGAGVFGPASSRLDLEGETGRIRVGAAAGPIRVELPRGLPTADLLVDGRVYLSKRGEAVDLRVTPVHRSATEIRLRAGS